MPKIRYAETNTVNGYYLPHWFSVVMPEETENLITNPSVENDTTGYTAVGAGAAIARTLDEQRRGAYSIRVTPAVGVASGVYYGTIATAINEPYTFSLDVLGVAGHVYNVYFADNAGARVGASYEFTATGHWQRVRITFVEDTGAVVRRLYLVQDAGDVQPFYTDGWQVENKSYDTTYCDGDLTGFVTGEVAYYWTGLYHGSTSVRVATTRSGGRIINLREYGFRLLGSQGLGLAPVVNYSLPSNLGGAYYQSTIEGVREFALLGDICFEHYYQVSRAKSQLERAFSYNLTPYRQPLLLHFQETDDCGNPVGDEVYIKCLYDSGLEGVTDNLTGEKLAIRFTAFDKDALIADGDRAISILTKTPVAAERIVRLSSDGTWDNICSSTTFTGTPVIADTIVASDGSLYVGGRITSINGVAVNFVARYSNGVWSALGLGITGGAGAKVQCCVEGSDGRIYFGGLFNTAGGAAASNIAVWNPATSTWAALGAGLDFVARDMTFLPNGKLVVVGEFLNAGGAPASRIAVWDPDAATWSAVGAGLDGVGVAVITAPLGNKVYIAGFFNTGGGVTLNKIGLVDIDTSTYTALSGGVDAGTAIYAIAFDKNLYLHARGDFTSIGGVTVPNKYAYWNGSQWSAPSVNLAQSEEHNLSVSHITGDILIGTYDSAIIPTETPVRAKNTTNFQKFGMLRSLYQRLLYGRDGTIILWADTDYFVGQYRNDIDNASNIRWAEMVVRQRFFTKTLHLVRSHELNQDASTRKVIAANETVKIDLKQFSAWSSFVGDFTGDFLPGSYIKLPDKFNVDITVLASDYIEIYNDNLALLDSNKENGILGANQNNTTNGVIYLTITNAGANYWIEFYSDAARTNLVGHTAPAAWTATTFLVLEIIPDGTNGISGYIVRTANVNVDADIYLEISVSDDYVLWGESYNSLSEARYS